MYIEVYGPINRETPINVKVNVPPHMLLCESFIIVEHRIWSDQIYIYYCNEHMNKYINVSNVFYYNKQQVIVNCYFNAIADGKCMLLFLAVYYQIGPR